MQVAPSSEEECGYIVKGNTKAERCGISLGLLAYLRFEGGWGGWIWGV